MFGYSAYDLPGGVAHVLCSTARCCAYDKVYYVLVLQLKNCNCLGCGMSIGNLCLFIRIVLSAKHLVLNKGHIAHAWQQRLIGFLKF